MAIGKKLTIVLSIVIVGCSVATYFRKDSSGFPFWSSRSDDPFARRVERRASTEAAWAARGSAAKPAEAGATRVPTVTTAAIAREPADTAAPPVFQKNLNPVGALLPPIEGVVDDDQRDLARDLAGGGSFAPAPGGSARHLVVDGDTLSKLAVRYLGQADAYLQIYEANRDVLSSPDLLPIGATLRIPPSTQAAAGNGPRAGQQLAPTTQLELVPVPGNVFDARP